MMIAGLAAFFLGAMAYLATCGVTFVTIDYTALAAISCVCLGFMIFLLEDYKRRLKRVMARYQESIDTYEDIISKQNKMLIQNDIVPVISWDSEE